MGHPSFNGSQGPFMKPARQTCRGYSLIELLVVLTIVGILSMVGVSMLGNRAGSSVRSVMDELEGTLMNAQKTAVVTSRDIYVATTGNWVAGTTVLDARALNDAAVANPPTAADLKAGVDAKRRGSPSECFRSLFTRNRDHQSAGVDCGAGWYAIARATAPELKDVEPVTSDPAFVDAMANPLFTGADKTIFVNGLTRRFETGFCIVVVGLRAGAAIPGGPIGVLLVPARSSNVYRYYKPDGSTTWRRQ